MPLRRDLEPPMTPLSAALPRRDQILTATLDLLATTPLERLTTRHIAARVGVSQPALFRHFRTREALLLAVAEEARAALGARLTVLLAKPMTPLDRCLELAQLLADFVDRHPGLPRLLFADLAFEAPELRLAVRQLIGMQHTLVATLVTDAQLDSSVRADVQAQAAATLFVAMVQGLALQGLVEGSPDMPPMRERLAAVVELWRSAIQSAEGSPQVVKPAMPPRRARALVLDVRPILARGVDPLAEVLATIETLAPSSVLVITAPFRPKPLETLLTTRGHVVSAHPAPGGLWSLLVVVDSAAPCVDLRDLEPPEPLEYLVTTAMHLAPGQSLLAHVPRNPRLLLPQLQARGHAFEVAELADGTAVVRVEAAS